MRVAAIDCGTNSIRLLIADVETEPPSLVDVVRTMKVVRLGQGVDETGTLADEALKRTFAATDEIAAQCAEHQVEAIRFVATSATRDADNREAFVEGIQTRLGVAPEVISGDEEAALAISGATASLGSEHAGPFLVVDIGGGSTEIVLGTDEPEAAISIDVGCVRMTERHLAGDPPSVEQIADATADIDAALQRAFSVVPVERTATVVGLAGSVTTVTAHALKLNSYEPAAIHGAVHTVDDCIGAASDLLAMTQAERGALGFMHPGRVDVIGAGALVWRTLVQRVRERVAAADRDIDTVVTSEHDILDGIAWSLARSRD